MKEVHRMHGMRWDIFEGNPFKRHKENVHESRNTSCGKKNSRKDSLTQHVKKNICKI